MVILYAARHRLPVPRLARWMLAFGIAASLAVNVAQGWSHGLVGAVVAAWPAVALVGSYELLAWMIRTAATGGPDRVPEADHRVPRADQPGAGAGPAAQAVEMFADLLAEVRAYGEGLVIVEQIPAKLIPDAIKNTAVKIVHRLPAADDRDAVGATINLTPAQSEYLVTLSPGDAAVHADGMDYPLLARMPDGRAREAARPVVAASAGPVTARRSPACGPDCLAGPCTLGQMRAAQRAAVTDPRITVWAELSVVAHLTGWDMPRPAPAFTASLRAMGASARVRVSRMARSFPYWWLPLSPPLRSGVSLLAGQAATWSGSSATSAPAAREHTRT